MIYREPMTPVEALLALATRGGRSVAQDSDLVESFNQVGERACRAAARQNQVEAVVGAGLEAAGAELSREWTAALDANERRVQALHTALRSVLGELQCRAAVVESAGVLFGSDLPMRGFGSGDFDVLVERACWDDAKRAFAAHGFEPADRRNRPTTRIEYRREAPDGALQWLEVGFQPFDRAWIPLAHQDRCPIWLGRCIPSRKDPQVPVLDTTDSLVFVSMHTSLHSFIRAPGLRLHVDVDRLTRDSRIDWQRYLAEVEAMRIPTRAFVSLSTAAGLLGTPVPEWVLCRLYPGDRRWAQLRGLLARDGVFVRGRPKLAGWRTIALDVLLDERKPTAWARAVLWPPPDWMREHFARGERAPGPVWQLHLMRALRLATRWRPE